MRIRTANNRRRRAERSKKEIATWYDEASGIDQSVFVEMAAIGSETSGIYLSGDFHGADCVRTFVPIRYLTKEEFEAEYSTVDKG